jgi:hypothetical protein
MVFLVLSRQIIAAYGSIVIFWGKFCKIASPGSSVQC